MVDFKNLAIKSGSILANNAAGLAFKYVDPQVSSLLSSAKLGANEKWAKVILYDAAAILSVAVSDEFLSKDYEKLAADYIASFASGLATSTIAADPYQKRVVFAPVASQPQKQAVSTVWLYME